MQKKTIIIVIILTLAMFPLITIAQGKPDLSITDDELIGANDITFSDDTPETGQEVIINATIHNDSPTSLEDAKNIEVLFNDTYRVGQQQITENIGRTTIAEIKRGESNTTSIKWIPKTSGRHIITVIIDPENKIDEQNENNNQADDEVIVSPSTELEVTIELGKGESGKSGRYYPKEEFWVNGTVKWSSGAPVRGADVEITIVETNATWNTTTDENGVYEKNISAPEIKKRYTIKVNASRGSQSGENSTGFRVTSYPLVDLDISFNIEPLRAKVGDKVRLIVVIRNVGGVNAENITVNFFVENETIDKKTGEEIPMNETKTFSADWIAKEGKWVMKVEIYLDDELFDSKNRTITVEEALPPLIPVDFTTIFIIGVIILIIAISLLIIRKRKKKES